MIRLLPVIALLWAGCSRHREAPADTVGRYFHAIAAGDCASVTPLLADPKATCDQMREEYKEQQVEYLGVQKVEPDGRDPKVTLVSVKLHYKKGDHVWIIRVTDDGGHPKLRF